MLLVNITMERPSSGPLGVCFRRLPSGDKTNSVFQKVDFNPLKLKRQNTFLDRTYKIEVIQMDPLGSAFTDSLRGIKKTVSLNLSFHLFFFLNKTN